ncbi:MAG: glycosyltransferase [Chloroflexi bacterium]|nr:glycosyltransferase [Chloroflexota bacterium]
MKGAGLLNALVVAQLLLGMRVLTRVARGIGARRIRVTSAVAGDNGTVAVIVPVLDEMDRLGPCLDRLIGQGSEVREIVVVDGGSHDGTQELVRAYSVRDGRVRLVDASPVPHDWNGKAWGLQVGLEQADTGAAWALMIDADVRPQPELARSLLAHARHENVAALSVATRQEVSGALEALLHPALLTTLVYRFGPPGRATRRVREVQANGQCFLARRDALEACRAVVGARASICEDITIARALVAAGHPVGFYEGEDLVSVEMYRDWRDAWRNWPRSLPMRDQYSGVSSVLGLCEVALTQALPLPLFILLLVRARRTYPALVVDGVLVAVRLGVLVGTARAYRRVPPTYWLSPLCDVPVALRLWQSLLQRRHTWRGRVLVNGGLP